MSVKVSDNAERIKAQAHSVTQLSNTLQDVRVLSDGSQVRISVPDWKNESEDMIMGLYQEKLEAQKVSIEAAQEYLGFTSRSDRMVRRLKARLRVAETLCAENSGSIGFARKAIESSEKAKVVAESAVYRSGEWQLEYHEQKEEEVVQRPSLENTWI